MAPHMIGLRTDRPKIILPGSLEQWEVEHRAGVRRAVRRAFSTTLWALLYGWLILNVIGFMFATGCGHKACVQPEWWPSWMMLPAKALLEFLKSIASGAQ
jgi:hypothetical protein